MRDPRDLSVWSKTPRRAALSAIILGDQDQRWGYSQMRAVLDGTFAHARSPAYSDMTRAELLHHFGELQHRGYAAMQLGRAMLAFCDAAGVVDLPHGPQGERQRRLIDNAFEAVWAVLGKEAQ